MWKDSGEMVMWTKLPWIFKTRKAAEERRRSWNGKNLNYRRIEVVKAVVA